MSKKDCNCDSFTLLLRGFFNHVLSPELPIFKTELPPWLSSCEVDKLRSFLVESLIEDYNSRLLLKTANNELYRKPSAFPSVFVEQYNVNEGLQWVWHKWAHLLWPTIKKIKIKCPQINISDDVAQSFLKDWESGAGAIATATATASRDKLLIESTVYNPKAKWRVASFQLQAENVVELSLKYLLTNQNQNQNQAFCKQHEHSSGKFSVEIATKGGDDDSLLLVKCVSNIANRLGVSRSRQNGQSVCVPVDEFTVIPEEIPATNVLVNFQLNSNSDLENINKDKDHDEEVGLKLELEVVTEICPSEFVSQYSETVVILYNYARLKSILDRYEGLVESGEYPQIPPLDQVDFSLVSQSKEELPLILMMLMWPRVLLNTINVLKREKGCGEKINLTFLFDFVKAVARAFDAFYGRNIIIVAPSASHNFKRMFARLYFLQGVGKIIKEFIELTGVQMD